MALQRDYDVTTLQSYNPTTLQPYNLITLLIRSLQGWQMFWDGFLELFPVSKTWLKKKFAEGNFNTEFKWKINTVRP